MSRMFASSQTQRLVIVMVIAYEGGGGADICGRYIEFEDGQLKLARHQRWKNDKSKRICRNSGKHWLENSREKKPT